MDAHKISKIRTVHADKNLEYDQRGKGKNLVNTHTTILEVTSTLLLQPPLPIKIPSEYSELLHNVSIVIFAELLGEYTAALTKIVAGIIPRRPDDRRDLRIGCLSLPRPSSSPVPVFSTHLVDF
ncbi:unnamed protein product [Thlaspi arvense]|uniref:Uncharacterized protein n=1 Tax=Thlaspi arvense TaxID=13288 RepID=A0AAU9T263_THLAR|nr:unnamed protein product [Thlaspi arvense]